MTPNWINNAACKGKNPDWFHPPIDKGHLANRGLKVCEECQVKQQCLEFALSFSSHQDIAGIYGGTTPEDRQRIRAGKPLRKRKKSGPKPRPITGLD